MFGGGLLREVLVVKSHSSREEGPAVKVDLSDEEQVEQFRKDVG